MLQLLVKLGTVVIRATVLFQFNIEEAKTSMQGIELARICTVKGIQVNSVCVPETIDFFHLQPRTEVEFV
jgi:hypothetical protein